MRHFLSFTFGISLVALLAAPVFAEGMPGMPGMPGMAAGSQPTTHTCSAGQKWIKGYKKKNGAQVKGYCRGAKSAPAKTGYHAK